MVSQDIDRNRRRTGRGSEREPARPPAGTGEREAGTGRPARPSTAPPTPTARPTGPAPRTPTAQPERIPFEDPNAGGNPFVTTNLGSSSTPGEEGLEAQFGNLSGVDPILPDEEDEPITEDEATGGGPGASQLAAIVDPDIFRSIVDSLDELAGEVIVAVDRAPDGSVVVTIGSPDGERQITIDATTASGGLNIQNQQLELNRRQQELDETFRRDELRINQQIAQLQQEIELERIRADTLISQGELALALETQNRIDERERAARQLERDLFNANMDHNRDVLELERSKFDLERQRYLLELSGQPGNLLDFFAVSRGQAPPGLGGALPEGISRAVGLNPLQQANAGQVISVPELPEFGEAAQVGAENQVPQSEFDLSQFFAQLPSFESLLGNAQAGSGAGAGSSPSVTGEATQPAPAPTSSAPTVPQQVDPNTGQLPPDLNDALTGGGETDQAARQQANVADFATTGNNSTGQQIIQALGGDPAAAIREIMAASGMDLGATAGASQNQADLAAAAGELGPAPENTGDIGQQPQQSSGFELPAELQAVFGGGQAGDAGTLQLPDTGVPFLSPQQLAGMTPAARELYGALIRATGVREQDFDFIGGQRLPGQRQVSRRV